MTRPARDSRPDSALAPAGADGQSGITLIELMVTITILALLLLATMPGIGQWLRNTSIRNAAES
ncbi:MAG: hypothetical protein RL722_722, partial [Pseudomonadota bacterium]